MYVVYCQNKPVSEYIVSEYIDTYFEVDIQIELSLVIYYIKKFFNFFKKLILILC